MSGPGKSHRKGITLVDLVRMFPDEAAAREWFEAIRWPLGRACPKCGSTRTVTVTGERPMPYRCMDCRGHFSVKTGTVMQSSKLPLQKWAFGIYLMSTHLKGVSSMKLHRDLGISQKTAWMLIHKIREGFLGPHHGDGSGLSGTVEVDETYIGGKRANMSNAKRRELADTGRGAVGKAAVVGIKQRGGSVVAKHVPNVGAADLVPFVESHAAPGATVYTDENAAYAGLATPLNGFEHESVKHSVSEYVRGQAHTNGVESFWALLKRGYKGTYHKMSPKHLARYVNEFAGRHNIRDMDTLAQMVAIAQGMDGRRLPWRVLAADNGLPSGARG